MSSRPHKLIEIRSDDSATAAQDRGRWHLAVEWNEAEVDSSDVRQDPEPKHLSSQSPFRDNIDVVDWDDQQEGEALQEIKDTPDLKIRPAEVPKTRNAR